MKLSSARRGLCCAVGMSLILAFLGGCAAPGRRDEVVQKPTLQEQVAESLSAAEKAQQDGQTDKALSQLDGAIKLDPSAKAPWLKKAQIYFDAKQYGQAITAAQEVLQRDVNDLTAKSIMAVSGLRVGSDALEQLRKANEVTGNTRSEAEGVAKIIREALGESILPTPETKPKGSGRSAARPAVNGTGTRATASTSNAVKPAAAATTQGSTGRGNPFGALQ